MVKRIKKWFALNRFWYGATIILVVIAASQLSENPLEVIGYAGLFLGAMAFAEANWLRIRINHLQEFLLKKGHLGGEDFKLENFANDED